MHKNAQKLSEKLKAKFPATTRTHGYYMVKIALIMLSQKFLNWKQAK